MSELYECMACGNVGELYDMHTEEVDGIIMCLECNGGGEVCLQSEIRQFETMVEERKPKYDFSAILDEDIF
jgi:hypothetical protein